MGDIIAIVLPVFAIILFGYLCRTSGKLGSHAASEINKAVVWVFLPALLFKICATSHFNEIWKPEFVISYTLGCIIVFAFIFVWRLLQRHDLKIASIDGLSVSYANTGYIGIPFCVLLFGENGLKPAMIATLIVVVVLFAISVILIEVSQQKAASFWMTIKNIVIALLKNPIIIAPTLGFGYAWLGLGIAKPFMHLLDMLALATSPCALISLGLFLAEKKPAFQSRSFIPLVFAKLILQPVVTAFFVLWVFDLPKMWAHSAIVLSALPTGTGPYMLAELYRTEAKTISESILWSTVLSMLTLTGLLIFFN
ncbi:AEC family transporter [Acinetobacter stercoris]|uniref:Putative transporter YfdV n=1 Tax=Acinetobacter stercoris TaxID=2126983 RepID=A0A2U3MZB3_9GAMM|nr:AEC family transporter [Acinetobacter stercoris]SPL70734.1 putative transporter YfdV [Acinetobacter stercoris]